MDIIENQKTSGPVNARLTSGPGIYFNAFIHVYSPGKGTDNSLGTNVDINRKPLSLCPFVASFKTIFLKLNLNTFKCFIHVYSPRAGTSRTTPGGQNFYVNINSLSLCPFLASLKNISLKSDFLPFFMSVFFSNVYSPRQGQTIHWWQKFYDNRKAFSLCPYVASFKMISSKSDFIHIFFIILYIYIAPRQGKTNPWGQNFDVSRKLLPLRPFVAKKSLWIQILYTFFHAFPRV